MGLLGNPNTAPRLPRGSRLIATALLLGSLLEVASCASDAAGCPTGISNQPGGWNIFNSDRNGVLVTTYDGLLGGLQLNIINGVRAQLAGQFYDAEQARQDAIQSGDQDKATQKWNTEVDTIFQAAGAGLYEDAHLGLDILYHRGLAAPTVNLQRTPPKFYEFESKLDGMQQAAAGTAMAGLNPELAFNLAAALPEDRVEVTLESLRQQEADIDISLLHSGILSNILRARQDIPMIPMVAEHCGYIQSPFQSQAEEALKQTGLAA